ncbi:MAG: sialate O-acetylesterase [Bacteroidales bacterium]|nr:sialate O-acetylesterase [Bacteroidales bacterium]
MKRWILLSLAFLCGAYFLQAEVWMPSVFSDNMVLQQQSDVAFWGKAQAGAKVSIRPSWKGAKTVSVQADAEGKWSARIQTPGAGGPYTIVVSDGKKRTFSNVLVGEVWFCSGQSNMEMPVKGLKGQPVEGGFDAILGAEKQLPLRMCTVKKCVSATPKDDCDALWLENEADVVANTSAAAYFFARDIQKALGVPVGILIADWGGTGIEPWMSREVLSRDFPTTDLSHLDMDPMPKLPQYKGATLYNGMVHPLIPYTVKGWIWYQGESNRGDGMKYASLQASYVAMMRELWQNEKMPFYFVQIAPYAFRAEPEGETAALLMEAQEKSLDMIPYCGMATTADIGEEWCIHPRKKQEVGRRLALLALKKTYGKALQGAAAPRYDRMEVFPNRVVLYFKDNDCGLGPVNQNFEGFEMAGEDRVFYPAKARVMRGYDTIELTCPEVPVPASIRYIFHNYAPGVLKNGSGIPVGPFRTDTWPEKSKE